MRAERKAFSDWISWSYTGAAVKALDKPRKALESVIDEVERRAFIAGYRAGQRSKRKRK